ncbi:BTB/POZ domain-containing protein 6-A [Rhipicephalus microplus]|uniref:BTB/POZ domain-containing protein 6-A n=1 Tax=Rhipicephalus microplus TaxID=6941 RepID=UPI003F6CD739
MSEYCSYCRNDWKTCPYCRRTRPARRDASTQVEMGPEFSLSHTLASGDLADVEFWVESTHFPGQSASFKAHKVIVALQNDVFKAMFYGDFAKEDRIVITDLHPEGVRGLLRYFYSGCLEVGTVHQAACTRTAAAKYLVPQLEQQCLRFINSSMAPNDVCPFLDYIMTVGEDALATPATIVIVKDSPKVLSSRAFKSCTEATIKYVLKHVTNVAETLVLRAVYAWGRQCLTRGKESCMTERPKLGDHEKEEFRAALAPLFPELRFLALTPQEFVEGPNAWGVLTDAEARAIVSNILKAGSMPMPAGFCKIREARA